MALAAICMMAVLAVGGGYLWASSRGPKTYAFPDVEAATLSPARADIIKVERQQYEHPQPGTVYAQGAKENWCADFVSWIYRRAGHSLTNPVSGSWRIPGVATMTDALQKSGAWRERGSYTPAAGDIVVYAPGSVWNQHVNLVIRNDGGVLTTIGGNQNGKIEVAKIKASDGGIAGYGDVLG